MLFLLFFFNDTATTEIYTLSLHDALPILAQQLGVAPREVLFFVLARLVGHRGAQGRSEEHTSELQSLAYLVCRLLLEKKKKMTGRSVLDTTETRVSSRIVHRVVVQYVGFA